MDPYSERGDRLMMLGVDDPMQGRVGGVAEADSVPHDGVEHRLEIRRGVCDHAEDLGRSRLLL